MTEYQWKILCKFMLYAIGRLGPYGYLTKQQADDYYSIMKDLEEVSK